MVNDMKSANQSLRVRTSRKINSPEHSKVVDALSASSRELDGATTELEHAACDCERCDPTRAAPMIDREN